MTKSTAALKKNLTKKNVETQRYLTGKAEEEEEESWTGKSVYKMFSICYEYLSCVTSRGRELGKGRSRSRGGAGPLQLFWARGGGVVVLCWTAVDPGSQRSVVCVHCVDYHCTVCCVKMKAVYMNLKKLSNVILEMFLTQIQVTLYWMQL